MSDPLDTNGGAGETSGAPTWTSTQLAFLAFLAATVPMWLNAYLSPPDSASYFSMARTLVLGRELDFYDDYAAFEYETYFVYITDRARLSNDWPAGSGVVWAPAFAAAHAVAHLAAFVGIDTPNLAPNGIGGVYKLLVSLWVVVLGAGALVLGMRVAESIAGRRAALGAAFCVLLGTPVGFYLYCYALMSHLTSMAAVGVLFCGWHTTRGTARTLRQWALLGVAAGVMVMIRPQNLGFLVVFLLEPLFEPDAIRADPRRWVSGVGLAALTAGIAFSPQMIVWKTLYGHALQLPKIEEMHWLAPNLRETLLSDYHGILAWSPVMILALPGVLLLWKRDRLLATAIGVTVLLQFYFNAANEIWWAGGSFGNRRMVNCGVPLLVAIAATLGGVRRAFILPVAASLTAWSFLLMAMERAGQLSLDHYVPWNLDFLRKLAAFALPTRLLPAMMGDFAGFGWGVRAGALLLGLGGVAVAWRCRRRATEPPAIDSAPESSRASAASAAGWARRGRHPAVALAAGYALVVPAWVLFAAARSEFTPPADLEFEVPRTNRSLFNGYYEYGYYLILKGRPEEALRAYAKAAELRPKFANPYRYLATVHLDFYNDADKALEYTAHALELEPRYLQALDIECDAALRKLGLDPAALAVMRREYGTVLEAFARGALRRQVLARLIPNLRADSSLWPLVDRLELRFSAAGMDEVAADVRALAIVGDRTHMPNEAVATTKLPYVDPTPTPNPTPLPPEFH